MCLKFQAITLKHQEGSKQLSNFTISMKTLLKNLILLKKIRRKYPQTSLILMANHKERLEQDHSERILRNNRFVSAIIYDYAHNNVVFFLDGIRSDQLVDLHPIRKAVPDSVCESRKDGQAEPYRQESGSVDGRGRASDEVDYQ